MLTLAVGGERQVICRGSVVLKDNAMSLLNEVLTT